MIAPTYLLDTNSCIYLIARTHPSLNQAVGRRRPGVVAISAIVYAELAMGLEKLGEEGERLLANFVGAIPVVPFDETAARAYARVPFRRGKLDRLIAAHALGLDAILITNNEGDFADVPGLKVENWVRE